MTDLNSSSILCDSFSDGSVSFDVEEVYKAIEEDGYIIPGEDEDDTETEEPDDNPDDNPDDSKADPKVKNIDLNITEPNNDTFIASMEIEKISENKNIDDIVKLDSGKHGYVLVVTMKNENGLVTVLFYRLNPQNSHNVTINTGTTVGYFKYELEDQSQTSWDTDPLPEIVFTFRNKSDDIITMITFRDLNVKDTEEVGTCVFGSDYFNI